MKLRLITALILTLCVHKLCAQSTILYNEKGLLLGYDTKYFNTVSIETVNFFDQYEIKVTIANKTSNPIYYDGVRGAIASITFEKDAILEKLLKKVAWRTDNGNYKYRYDDSIPRSKNYLDFGFPDGKWVWYNQPVPYNPNEMFPKADLIQHLMLADQVDTCTIYILVAQDTSPPIPKWKVSEPVIKEKFKKERIQEIPEQCMCFGRNKPRGKRGDIPKNAKKPELISANNAVVNNNLGHNIIAKQLRSVQELKNLILKNLRENTFPYNGGKEDANAKSTFYFKNHMYSFDKNYFYSEFEMANYFASKITDYKQYITPQLLKTKIPIIGLKSVSKYQSNSSSPMQLNFINEGGESSQNQWSEYQGGQLRKTTPAGPTDNCICWVIGYRFDTDFKNYNELRDLIIELNKVIKAQNPNATPQKRSKEELKQFILTTLRNNTKDVIIKYSDTEASNTPGIVKFSNYQFAINQNILSFSVDYIVGDNSLKYWKPKTLHIDTKLDLTENIVANEYFTLPAFDQNVFVWETYGQMEAEKRVVSLSPLFLNRNKTNTSYSILNGKRIEGIPYGNIYGFDKGSGRKNFVELKKALSEYAHID